MTTGSAFRTTRSSTSAASCRSRRATRSIPANAFIFLTGNTNNLADGIYQNTSGSAIGSGATFTLSNLTRCYQETGALNTLYGKIANFIKSVSATTNITYSANSSGYLQIGYQTPADLVSSGQILFARLDSGSVANLNGFQATIAFLNTANIYIEYYAPVAVNDVALTIKLYYISI